MRRAIAGLWGIVLAGYATSGHALDLEYTAWNGLTILYVEGAFEFGDEQRFASTFRHYGGVDEVWFNSPGGNLHAGVEIGRFLKREGIATRVPNGADCASACVYAFLGGVIRACDPKGRLGVHMASITGSDELIYSATALIYEHGPEAARFIAQLYEQHAARSAVELAKYLVESGVSLELMTPTTGTAHDDVHWLTRSELERYNVVNVP